MSVRCARSASVALALAALLLTGCGHSGEGVRDAGDGPGTLADVSTDSVTDAAGGAHAGRAAPEPVRPREIPALGHATRARIPAASTQALVVTGEGADASRATAVLYTRDPVRGWLPADGPWPARNAARGWTAEHHLGDLRSPVGVFGLTDAGGRLADPGTRLPYDHRSAFTADGTGVEGEPLAGSFDYVVAVNYNRKPGTTPLDWTRPLGAERGGGIWLHVDHGGPTHGCVALPRERMRQLLRTLDPARTPVVVMGDAAALSR
ncbi:L,D-transpeptidase family protein [Streptomyces sp. BPTC-684]|uniref:L,D-transpeptidase family protein n=1 Tax=Streptomyces sp. BPTC-684 TaxID=3043734 RepID=UPI0024B225EF|nr:L,D-transpeptidase family protein [Streptomyces sp. BPTC-684]WHM37828.1 L,D-transpeptidase family protein [Streptomyces sp. BPTC-684]